VESSRSLGRETHYAKWQDDPLELKENIMHKTILDCLASGELQSAEYGTDYTVSTERPKDADLFCSSCEKYWKVTEVKN
jgi:hypothetical protein